MNKQTFLTLLATFALLFSFTFSCHAKGKDKAKHVVFIGLVHRCRLLFPTECKNSKSLGFVTPMMLYVFGLRLPMGLAQC